MSGPLIRFMRDVLTDPNLRQMCMLSACLKYLTDRDELHIEIQTVKK